MGILRKLREWRENEDGTLEGPSLNTGTVHSDSVNALDTQTLPLASAGDPADARQIAVSPDGELLIATEVE